MRNPKFLGVYSLKTAAANGPKPKFFVWLLPDGNYAIQELDASLSQRGPARGVPAKSLDKAFKAESSILAAPVTTPDFRPLLPPETKATPQPAQPGGGKPAAFAPEQPQSMQVEAALRASFLKAIKALKRPREKPGAMSLLERILRAQKGIEPEHKHMFRDFGVALRKQSQLKLALLSAQRAVTLAPHDDHARFNLARILALMGRYQEAEAQLAAARKLDPSEKVYPVFAAYLNREKGRPSGLSLEDDE